jgi:hypothetical protein
MRPTGPAPKMTIDSPGRNPYMGDVRRHKTFGRKNVYRKLHSMPSLGKKFNVSDYVIKSEQRAP